MLSTEDSNCNHLNTSYAIYWRQQLLSEYATCNILKTAIANGIWQMLSTEDSNYNLLNTAHIVYWRQELQSSEYTHFVLKKTIAIFWIQHMHMQSTEDSNCNLLNTTHVSSEDSNSNLNTSRFYWRQKLQSTEYITRFLLKTAIAIFW